ncbi:type IX secretion system membrane protein PorP/SprF [Cytophagaceae bacterium ABcell3]|nr:type IX secretion system membrane protein PorP/SprF [Cytophagaceae bacterium ABcell3]
MKKLLVLFCLQLIVIAAYGQQRPQYSQYMVNPFLLNPAVAGTEDYADFRAGYRNQWVGFPGAPKTLYLSGHAPIGKKLVENNRSRIKKNGFHGVGGIITNDVTGPSRRMTITGTYAYHLKIAPKTYISMGLSGGIQQYVLDESQLTTVIDNDPLIHGISNTSLADVSTGFWLYSPDFYVGGSINQIFNPVIFSHHTNEMENHGRLNHHYFITSGVRIPIDHDWSLIPSVVLKGVSPAPLSFDINCKVRYQNVAWGGVSYRRTDAVAAMVGFILNDRFDVSYSYDFITSNIRRYTGGSHEIVIGYRMPIVPGLVCPSKYW